MRFRSELEQRVHADLIGRGLVPRYEESKVPYLVQEAKLYVPDFQVGDVFIEVKGYWPREERMKLITVLRCNPEIKLFVAFQNPYTRIHKGSRTTYGAWASRHAIPWCSVPIPDTFLQSWLNGQATTHEMPKV